LRSAAGEVHRDHHGRTVLLEVFQDFLIRTFSFQARVTWWRGAGEAGRRMLRRPPFQSSMMFDAANTSFTLLPQ